jgi:hypothetical protein
MTPIASPLIPGLWARVYAQLRLSIAHGGEHTERSVFQALMNGQMILWMNDQGCVVTTWCDFPAGRIAYAQFVGGKNVKDWMGPAEEVFTQWAASIGCKELRMSGRKAWSRLVKNGDCQVLIRKGITP